MRKKWNDGGASNKWIIHCETIQNGACHNQKFKKKVKMIEFKCYCRLKFGHYDRECYFNKESNGNDTSVAQFEHVGSIDKKVILIANTHLIQDKTNTWYLNTWCINHMTDNKSWFIKLAESIQKFIKFADNNMVTS